MASSAEDTAEDFEHLSATAAPSAPTLSEDETSAENGTPSDAEGAGAASGEEGAAGGAFECNICLDVAHDAVVSLCGHLFCWPCLHTWLETRPNRQICPVCKAAIAKDKVVPLYGRGNTNPKDPRDKPIPPRPRGQRTEPENNGTGAGGGGFFGPFVGGGGMGGGAGGLQMSFGIGAFPFGFFTNFNVGGENNRNHAQVGTPQYDEEQIVHKFFLYVAMAFIFWLLVA